MTALLSGALLTLSFAPFYLAILAPIMLTILFALWAKSTTPKQALWSGFLFGIGFFGTSISWVFISIHRYGNTNALIAGIITLLFVMLLSIAPALAGYFSKRLLPRFHSVSSLFAIPGIWVLTELLRSYLLTGFPWVLLGQAQTNSFLRGFFQLVGIYGVSWLSAFISICLLMAMTGHWRLRIIASSCLLLLLIIATCLMPVTFTQKSGKAIAISLVQGNIARQMKWDPLYIQHIIDTYLTLSKPLWSKSDVLIWPENAISVLDTQAMPLLNTLNLQAKKTKTTFITGLPIDQSNQYYNGAIALGLNHGEYLKRHLVPFGEYVPLESWLRGIIGFFDLPMSTLSAGPEAQTPIQINKHNIRIAICYEIAYAQAMRNLMLDSHWLVVLSDDSWFGKSLASEQQLQMAQVRALESGRFVISATNSGETAVINPQGYLIAALPEYKPGVLRATIWPMAGITPWLWMGIWPLLCVCLGIVLVINYYQR